MFFNLISSRGFWRFIRWSGWPNYSRNRFEKPDFRKIWSSTSIPHLYISRSLQSFNLFNKPNSNSNIKIQIHCFLIDETKIYIYSIKSQPKSKKVNKNQQIETNKGGENEYWPSRNGGEVKLRFLLMLLSELLIHGNLCLLHFSRICRSRDFCVTGQISFFLDF